MASKQNLRSISLPSRSHPTTLRVEEELNKLKTTITIQSSSSTSSICSNLSGIQELHKSMNDLLNMSSTQQLLSDFRNEKCLEQFLDGSVKLLDLCEITRDMLLQLNEQIQALQSAFRRRKGKGESETSVEKYTCLRKKMKKDAIKVIAALKQFEITDHHCHLIQLLKDVFVMNSVVFRSVMMFLCGGGSSKPKRNGWFMISKLMHRGGVICEEQTVNEMESADHAVLIAKFDCENAQKRLGDLGRSIEDIEKCLEGVFRGLIKTRASILNIISL
ncbi:uncharacterized protein [Euphorbia lathyris]|uniref:uncharacterized protein n=1 Tax=Euphorbia lathyris TaxID=212925 RepID=UPI0033138339